MLPRSMVIHSINRGQRNGVNKATKTNIVDGQADKPPWFYLSGETVIGSIKQQMDTERTEAGNFLIHKKGVKIPNNF